VKIPSKSYYMLEAFDDVFECLKPFPQIELIVMIPNAAMDGMGFSHTAMLRSCTFSLVFVRYSETEK